MNPRISNLLGKSYAAPALCGVAAFATGLTAIYVSRLINKEKDIVVPAEEDKVQESITSELEGLSSPDEFYHSTDVYVQEVVEETPARVNVFMSESDDDWDYEFELEQRDPDFPYVLHADEYINDEMGYRQATVTYYAGDDIMADMSDTPIYNWASLMGPLEWGHGSKDKNVVYIRNEKVRKEWEVLLHRGSYEIEVTGFQMDKATGELQHSLRKFRDD